LAEVKVPQVKMWRVGLVKLLGSTKLCKQYKILLQWLRVNGVLASMSEVISSMSVIVIPLVSPLSFVRPRYNWLKNTMGDNYTAGLLIRAVAGKIIQ